MSLSLLDWRRSVAELYRQVRADAGVDPAGALEIIGFRMLQAVGGAMLMAKSQATTVCTETATARIRHAISFMARSSACHWRSLPVQPSESAR